MTERIIFAALTIFFCLTTHPAQAQTETDNGVIGTILEIQGSATVTPEGGQNAAAAIDTPLHMNDTVETGADSRVFILFIDNTELVLSEDTQVKIDNYIYDPDDNKDNSALYSIMRGAFQYTSGLIGKKENPDVRIETPVGSIGIRGTDFWAGEIDGEYGVVVNEGQVSLKTDGGEEVVSKGEGTSVRDRRSRPERAKAWNREKFQRAADRVRLKRNEMVRQRVSSMQERQQHLRSRYKEYMKTHRRNGQWEKQQRREENRQDRRERNKQQNTPQGNDDAQNQKLREKIQQYKQQREQKILPQNQNRGGGIKPGIRRNQGGR